MAEAGDDDEQRRQLVDIVRAAPRLMTVLTVVRDQGLPDPLVFSGAVYQTVWNALTHRSPDYGIKDYDVGYFDPDTSYGAEDIVIGRVAQALDEPLRSVVEVRNQARVHLWFHDHFGEPFEPLRSTAEALTRFVSPAFAVGIRLAADDDVSIVAPFGLQDVFAMQLRPNPTRPLAADWDRVVTSARARWPELTVDPHVPPTAASS